MVRQSLTLSDAERAALDEFRARARAVLGNELKEVRLFGSRARGEGHDEWDLDIALIVGPEGRAQRRVVYDLAFDVWLAHGIDIAPLVIEETRLQELRERERQLAHAREELERAETCLQEARALHAAAFPYGAVSRAYYAVFHASRALLLSIGLEARSHKALASLIGEHFVRPGRLSTAMGRLVSRM